MDSGGLSATRARRRALIRARTARIFAGLDAIAAAWDRHDAALAAAGEALTADDRDRAERAASLALAADLRQVRADRKAAQARAWEEYHEARRAVRLATPQQPDPQEHTL